MNKRARKHLEIALGGNMNIATLKPLALIEIMTDFAKKEVEAINYTRCCKTLNLEVKPTFEEWINVNFTKYDNEYYQDNGRNGIWKKHKLYELYENTTL
jgi:hypothetical protein